MRLSFAALSVLDFLIENIEQDQVIPENVCAREDLSSVHSELVDQGLLIDDGRMAGTPTFCVSPSRRMQARMVSRKYRQAAIQLAIMGRIEKNSDRGSTDEYYPQISVRGVPLAEAEYRRAIEHLMEWDLIKGAKSWGGAILRPELTSNGFTAFESGYAPQDWVQGGDVSMTSDNSTNYTMNNSGTLGAAQQGDQNTANVTQHVGLDAESFSAAIQGIREILKRGHLEALDLEAAQSQLELIEEQVEAGKPSARIGMLFRSLTNALPVAMASEIADLIGQAISALPG